jgi:hypothetical protein
VIDSRGSGEAAGAISPPGFKFFQEFQRLHPSAFVRLVANDYPAAGGFSLVGAAVKVPLAYHASVVTGKNWLSRTISTTATTCPQTKMFLTGYSQGAQVTADVYQNGSTPHVLGIALFGDPYFNSDDAIADRGSFRLGRHGGLGTRPLFSSASRGHVLSYCHDRDPVCQEPLGPLDYRFLFRFHDNYDKLGEPALAAAQFTRLDRASSVTSLSRPVVACPTEDVGGGTVRHGPSRISVSAPGAIAGTLVGYDANAIEIVGPSEWRCSSMIYGDGGQTIAISPRGEAPATFGKNTDPWPRPAAIAVTFIPGCAGCRADTICPFFKADAASYLSPCRGGVPPGEKVKRLSPIAVMFEDPPHVRGSTSYSGGELAVYGVVISVRDSQTRQGFALKETCALTTSAKETCTASLNTLVKTFKG